MAGSIPQDLYGRILEHMPICCVDIVVRHEGRVLLVYRNTEPAKDTWWFPGGRLLKGEDLADAARRKAREEVGVDVVVENKIGVYETRFPRGPFPEIETGIHSVNVCFVVRPVGDVAVALDATSDEHRWAERIEPDMVDYVKDVLRDAAIW